jgi:hypothetical protein
MNRKLLRELADFIESGAHPWNMRSPCGCFLGQAAALGVTDGRCFYEVFGLDDDTQVRPLCMPDGWDSWGRSQAYSRVQAIRTLRNLIKTGKVDWSVGASLA